jgi:uncharacterized protein YgbK (DUF1537 family)
VTSDRQAIKYLWYGDDFTGASDTLATFASAGLKALLCVGVPAPARLAAVGPLDALGIAGAARSMSPEALRREVDPVGRFARSLRVPLLHYKCCSTFDSSPTVGSLGEAMRTLERYMPNPLRAIVGGQPSLGRYCVFGNLFAAAGTGGEVFRIDRHPTMAHHPVTPMSEADLRLHLSKQGVPNIELVDWRQLDGASDEALDAQIAASLASGQCRAILFDALQAEHLQRIGRQIWRAAHSAPLLSVGASSVAEAIIAHWRQIGLCIADLPALEIAPARDPVFVLAGSQSAVTAAQVEAALTGGSDARYQSVALDIPSIVSDTTAVTAAAEQCAELLRQGHSVIAHTGRMTDGGHSQLSVAQAGGRLLANVMQRAPFVRRVGVAGGDTSSLAVEALDIWALGFAGTLSKGVTLTRANSEDKRIDGLELMLKGGQMGGPDLFKRLLGGLR